MKKSGMGRHPQPQIRQRLIDACTGYALEHGLPERLGLLAAAAGTSNRMLIQAFHDFLAMISAVPGVSAKSREAEDSR